MHVKQPGFTKSLDIGDSVSESIGFVVPVYNEAGLIESFGAALIEFLEANQFHHFEIVFVNDGSRDESFEILRMLSCRDKRIKVVNLARNFGKEIALTAGLDSVGGDAIVMLDADFQHPFSVILEFIAQWRAGNDMVFGVQRNRQQGWFRKKLSQTYYRIIKRLAPRQQIVEGAGDFRLLSRRAVKKLQMFREQHRVMKGLYPAIGLKQQGILFDAAPRPAGETKWRLGSLLNLALDGITACSTAPLRLATLMGVAAAGVCLLLAVITIAKTLFWGESVTGYPTLITVILFLGSIQLLCLGIMGEYLGRIFNETKNRPLYFIEDIYVAGSPIENRENDEAILPMRRAS